jgi:glycosyltransferase involved in cell wall biosynthesis
MSEDRQPPRGANASAPEPAARRSVIVVMPAYNAALTLEKTYREIPEGSYDSIILVDDASKDDTVRIARDLNLIVEVHPVNKGYGGNQKTCYSRALREGADIIVMLHPDNQYDPSIVPDLVAPIAQGEADVVLASRMLGSPLKGGMPRYKFIANKVLTAAENAVLKTRFSEFHTGYRAFSRKALQSVNYFANSNDFVFDNEILVQCLLKGMVFKEIPVTTRYAHDSSSVGFLRSCVYGLGILKTLAKYTLHVRGIRNDALFN